jgi:hypothetical protein
MTAEFEELLKNDPTPIYVTSKRMHASMWLHYRKRFNIISTWINIGVAEPEFLGNCWWPYWLAEAATAPYLIFYAKQGDAAHNSCLLEIGACLSGGGQILHVGISDTMKTANGELADFTYHPRWRRLPDLEMAFHVASIRLPASEPLPDVIR